MARKGFIVYVDPETRTKIHFRVDRSGYGVVILNASRVIYANQTATFYIEQLLKGASAEEAAKKAVKKFRGVSFEQAKKDFEDIAFKINSLLASDVCPITYLGFERLDPLSMEVSAPYRVDLAVTYRCNNRCVHCYSSSPRRIEELKTREWFKVIKKLYDVGVPNLLFTGGEPTLRDDLPELIRYAEKLGIVTGLVTNGRRLSDKKYLDSLVRAGLDYVQVTLESNRPGVHDNITMVEGSWAETVEGIRNVLATDLFLDVNMTLNRFNVDHVDEYVDFLYELGVENFSANRLIYSGKGLEVRRWFEPSFEETREALEIMVDKAYEYGMRFRWYGVTRYCELNPLELELELKFCSACSITLAVEPNGSVLPCQSYYQPLGNILRDSWDKIWGNPLCVEIRKRRYAEACASCPLFNACGGGCPLEAKIRPYRMPANTV